MAKADDSSLDPEELRAVQAAARRALDRASAWGMYHLNEQFPFIPDQNNKKGETGRYRQVKRAYGDYLWHQDRAMFENDYREHLEKAGR